MSRLSPYDGDSHAGKWSRHALHPRNARARTIGHNSNLHACFYSEAEASSRSNASVSPHLRSSNRHQESGNTPPHLELQFETVGLAPNICEGTLQEHELYYRARYYDPNAGRFISEDSSGFDDGIDFYSYVRNDSTNFTDPFGLYTTEPEVPLPLPPKLDKFMKCMDNCTGRDQHVNATTNGKHSDPGHAAGTTVDLRPIGTPSKTIFCCAGKCGAPYLLDERTLHTKHGTGPHFHIQLVAPLNPSPNAPNSIPDTPECKPGKCDTSK